MKNEIKIEVERFEGEPINILIGYKQNNGFVLLAKIGLDYLDDLIQKLQDTKKEVLNATVIH